MKRWNSDKEKDIPSQKNMSHTRNTDAKGKFLKNSSSVIMHIDDEHDGVNNANEMMKMMVSTILMR